MSKEFFSKYGVDEVSYFIDFIKQNIAAYRISELTNAVCGDIPSINGAHPLALEYGNALTSGDTEGNYTSILPAIGVEFLSDNESFSQFLGSGQSIESISEETIDEIKAIDLKNRVAQGLLISSTTINNIEAAKTAKGEEKLYAKVQRYLQDQTINISIWSQHVDVTRIVYLVLKSLLKRAKHDISSRGIKNLKITAQGSIYNYDFGRTLFGAEFQLNFISPFESVEVDTAWQTIKSVELTAFDQYGNPKFQPTGG